MPDEIRAAPPGGPVTTCHEGSSNAIESNAAVIELQAQPLRTRYSVAYVFACSLAPLVGGLPQ